VLPSRFLFISHKHFLAYVENILNLFCVEVNNCSNVFFEERFLHESTKKILQPGGKSSPTQWVKPQPGPNFLVWQPT